MSIQLIVYPQSYDGSFNPIVGATSQFMVDGINFATINTSTSSLSLAAPTFTNAISNMSVIPINTWYRFSGDLTAVTESSGSITIGAQRGVIQQLSNLAVNTGYTITIDVGTYASTLEIQQYTGTVLQATFPITSSGVTTISFQAQSTSDTILIYSTATNIINSISITARSIQPSGNTTFLGTDGQVICDLYEDEDIPLSLSVDDFKNVAEQVQSYSKAFNLPGTKRNNKIFDNLFEITRSDDGVIFNPYVKTQCKLKQDGFILFEGYLRMIDIQEKQGEISYNVNLYSEVIALADVLQDRKFSDLDFTELEHSYNKTNIKNSWNDSGTGISYTNSNTSGFRNAYDTVKYPFCDWNHQIIIANNPGGTSGPTDNNPQLTSLEQAFRPFINIKYLINRIFNQDNFPFTYESVFFDTTDFNKLYMDFNWGSALAPNNNLGEGEGENDNTTGVTAGTSYTRLQFDVESFSNASELGYDNSTSKFTANRDNQIFFVNSNFVIGYSGASAYANIGEIGFEKFNSSGAATGFVAGFEYLFAGSGTSGNIQYSNNFQVTLDNGESIRPAFKAESGITLTQKTTQQLAFATPNNTIVITGTSDITSEVLLETLRGDLGQWEFLKGIITMFNLVSIPDKNNPNHIKIEPYNDVFIENSDSKQLNWTDKIDVEEMKLEPLANLNKKTIFKFVEDDDDYAFQNYKYQVGGHLYGSKKFDASAFTILTGEQEIIAEPFAATVVKPLASQFSDFIVPAIYSYNPDDGTSEGFENSPRIMYDNGKKTLLTHSYYIPEQNGLSSENQNEFLQFSHLSNIPTTPTTTSDFNFGQCQLFPGVGSSTPNNLFNLYWLPYFKELYDANARTMTIKVNLTPGDISTFRFFDTVIIKNREFRVNKIDYKPNDLATIEFILIT